MAACLTLAFPVVAQDYPKGPELRDAVIRLASYRMCRDYPYIGKHGQYLYEESIPRAMAETGLSRDRLEAEVSILADDLIIETVKAGRDVHNCRAIANQYREIALRMEKEGKVLPME